jgi:hypothetical protein
MTPLYRSVDVWKRISKARVVRYRCFEDLSSGRFSVQSADFYKIPLDAKEVADSDKQYLELLAEQSPEERAGSFDSLEEAIEAHDKDFATEAEGRP